MIPCSYRIAYQVFAAFADAVVPGMSITVVVGPISRTGAMQVVSASDIRPGIVQDVCEEGVRVEILHADNHHIATINAQNIQRYAPAIVPKDIPPISSKD